MQSYLPILLRPYGVNDLSWYVQFLSLFLPSECLTFFWVTYYVFQYVLFLCHFDMSFGLIVVADWFVTLMSDVCKVFIQPIIERSLCFTYILYALCSREGGPH